MEKLAAKFQDFFKNNLKSAQIWTFTVDAVMLAVMLLVFLFPAILRAWFYYIQIALFGIQVFLFISFCTVMDSTSPDKAVLVRNVKLALGIFMMFAIGSPIRYLQSRSQGTGMFGVWILMLVISVALTIAILKSEKGKKAFEAMQNGKVLGSSVKVVKPGDIVLCNIKEEVMAGAKDPREILPAKDRFLHMLIIGSTGCGKTSQLIIPMLYQDIQNPDWGITVLEPKGDLAIKAYFMAKHFGREAIYFDPSFKGCPKFNPLAGREVDVLENIATTFKMLNPDSPQFFQDLNEQLIKNAIKVLKRLDKSEHVDGKYATLIWLSRLLQNSAGQGRDLVNQFARIKADTESEIKENMDIATWFLNEYFPERSKLYENTSGVRSQVAKLISNEYLREVLNPDFEAGERNQINFDRHLLNGGILCISTAQGALRDLSKYLGYFLILSLQSSVFRRPGTEDTRRPHALYIDEFQTYSTPGFSDMLTQGRSYRVSSILATQARAQMAMGGGRDGKNFVELVSANARNLVLFPGLSKDDAKYYSEQFGEYEKTEEVVSHSRKVFNLFTGGLNPLGHPSESTREQKKMTANFTITDLIFGKDGIVETGASFGHIVYCIIKNNSIQPAKVGMVSYIPKDLNDLLNEQILDYQAKFGPELMIDDDIDTPPASPKKEEKIEDEPGFIFDDEFSFGSDEDESSQNAQPTPVPAPTPSPAPGPTPMPAPGPAVTPQDPSSVFDNYFSDLA